MTAGGSSGSKKVARALLRAETRCFYGRTVEGAVRSVRDDVVALLFCASSRREQQKQQRQSAAAPHGHARGCGHRAQ